MKVKIMYRNTFNGGDGWTYFAMTIDIDDNCPTCGDPRGKPQYRHQCEDGQWYNVDVWRNPCGHVDYYKDVYFEHRERQRGHV